MNTTPPPWWFETRAGQVDLAEKASAREVERRQLLEQLRSVDAEHEKQTPLVAKRLADAKTKLAAAQGTLKNSEVAYSLALSASYGHGVVRDNTRGRLLAQLRKLRPEVDGFLSELRTMHHETQQTGFQSTNTLVVRGMFADNVYTTNAKSVAARQSAILAAMKQAEALIESDVEDIEGAINEIRQSIPEVDSMKLKTVSA